MIYEAKQVFEAKSAKQTPYRKAVPRTRKNSNYIVSEIIKISLSRGVDSICNRSLRY